MPIFMLVPQVKLPKRLDLEAEAPRPVDLPVEGADSLKAAVIPVILPYSLADPLAG